MNKGSDRIDILVEDNVTVLCDNGQHQYGSVDEIKSYLDC